MTSLQQKKKARKEADTFVVRKPRKDITGLRVGKLLVKEYYGSKHHSTYWRCVCECGNEKIVRYSHLTNAQITSCGCSKDVAGADHHRWTGHQEMSGCFLLNTRGNAARRNLGFKLTNEQLWDLYIQQDRLCALSGMPIGFDDHTASLDRIDSDKGYTLDNVQWVHKDINRMKNVFSQDYFIEVCQKIAEHNVG